MPHSHLWSPRSPLPDLLQSLRGRRGAHRRHLIVQPPLQVPAVPVSTPSMGATPPLPRTGAADTVGTEAWHGHAGIQGAGALPAVDPPWGSASKPVRRGGRGSLGSLLPTLPCSGLLSANKLLSGGPLVPPHMTGTQGTTPGRSKASWPSSLRQCWWGEPPVPLPADLPPRQMRLGLGEAMAPQGRGAGCMAGATSRAKAGKQGEGQRCRDWGNLGG